MFTGLVEAVGRFEEISPRGPGVQLSISAPPALVSELTLGESVAVDGACLTVVRWGGGRFTVDASAETMRRTTLGERRRGDPCHLERALRLGDRLGGHWVSGHIDDTGVLTERHPLGEALELNFSAPPGVMRYLVEKGSIAVDGTSLTINTLSEGGFSVVLVPHSQSCLYLPQRALGSRVNLEVDLLGKYVERLLGLNAASVTPEPSGLNKDILARAGFLR